MNKTPLLQKEKQQKPPPPLLEQEEEEDPYIKTYTKNHLETKGPYNKASLLSLASFSWLNPMFKLASKTAFTQNHHYKLKEIDKGETCLRNLKKNWYSRYPTGTQSPGVQTSAKGLIWVVVKTYPMYFIAYTIFSIIFSIIEFFNAKVMNLALKELKNEKSDFSDRMKGAGKLIFALILTDIALSILKGQSSFIISLLGLRIRHGINGLVFEKVMKKSMDRDTTFSLGEITNITQVDTPKIENMANFVNRVIIAPIELIIGGFWLYSLVGFRPLAAGISVMGVFLFLNTFISKKYKIYRSKFMDAKDKRGKLITEVFGNIRFIKMSGLENYFLEKIKRFKEEELLWIKKQLKRGVYSITINNAAPILFLVTLFTTYMIYNGSMDIPTVFTVMQVYGIFSRNFNFLPYFLIFLMDVSVSGQRIAFFLLSEEIDDSYIEKIEEGENSIEIYDGNFYWEDQDLKKMYKEEKRRIAEKENKKKKKKKDDGKKDDKEKEKEEEDVLDEERRRLACLRLEVSTSKNTQIKEKDDSLLDATSSYNSFISDSNSFVNESLHNIPENLYSGINFTLKNLNLKIKKGQLVALIGKVGSGKSSLLSCLSGEMYYKKGTKVKLQGEVAYVSQKAWIMSKSVKENILFNKEYSEKLYKDSIKFSCLKEDLKILNKGDDTQLGDKGVNLSGGQKIRLSIARAFYSDKEIYLFDDPISALDVHVGKYVMEEGIAGFLKGKTRVVATHAIAYLKFFDYIYVLDNGEVIEEGKYEEIVETEVFKEIKKSLKKEEEEEEEEEVFEEKGDLEELIGHFEDELKQEKEEEEGKSKEKELIIEDKKIENTLINKEKQKIKPPSKLDIKPPQLPTTTKKEEEIDLTKAIIGIKDLKEKKQIEDILLSEDRSKGKMSFKVIKQWLSLSGGFPRYLFIFIIMSVWSFTNAGIPYFLQWWSSNYSKDSGEKGEIKLFLQLYLSINFLQILCNYLRTDNIFMGNVELAREVNFLMSFRLMHASVSRYFDRVPLGRILNRFMADVEVIDNMLAWSTNFIFWTG